jgi:hypothetical protein
VRLPPTNVDAMGDSYRPLASYDVGMEGSIALTFDF